MKTVLPASTLTLLLTFLCTAYGCKQHNTFTFREARTAISAGEHRVAGTIDTSFQPQSYAGANYSVFLMSDKTGEKHRVILKQHLPDGFEYSSGIVITGRMSGNDFIATEVMMKCHSLYGYSSTSSPRIN